MKNKPAFIKKLKPNWKEYRLTPPWSCLSSRQLAFVLDVHLQSISNYVCRGFLTPEPRELFKGNTNYFRVSYIRSLFEDKSPEQIEWEWIDEFIKPDPPFTDLEQAYYVVKVCHNVYQVQKPFV